MSQLPVNFKSSMNAKDFSEVQKLGKILKNAGVEWKKDVRDNIKYEELAVNTQQKPQQGQGL